MMWFLFIFLFCIYVNLLGYAPHLLTVSVDLWMNVIITVIAIINNDLNLGNLIKRV